MRTVTVKSPEGETKAARIEWGLANRRCPYCGRDLTGVKMTGSGRFEDGQFCSLDCYARFHYCADVRNPAAG
jgi:hypothetical protein